MHPQRLPMAICVEGLLHEYCLTTVQKCSIHCFCKSWDARLMISFTTRSKWYLEMASLIN